MREDKGIQGTLKADFKAASKGMFARSSYELPSTHELPRSMLRAANGRAAAVGMSFWTDAAVLGDAGIPSILFGPTGAAMEMPMINPRRKREKVSVIILLPIKKRLQLQPLFGY